VTTLNLINVVNGVAEGQTLAVNALQGLLANDKDPSGFPLAVTAVASGALTSPLGGGSVTLKGTYGTLVMHADGSYTYSAAANISLPKDGIVQDSFTVTVSNGHGNTGSAVLAVTVMQSGDNYVGGTPGTTVNGGNGPTVLDASLGNQTVHAGNGPNALIGGANDTLTAGNGPVTVIGGPNDTITLGNGPDTLVVGANDTITVGSGPHSFIFDPANGTPTLSVPSTLTVAEDGTVAVPIAAGLPGFGKVVISGFAPQHDTIQFDTTVFANFAAVTAHAKQIGSDTVITQDPNDTITLKGVALSSLRASNFIFETGPSPLRGVTVTITGLPTDAALTDSLGPLTVVNGSITLTATQLAGLRLHAGEVTSAALSVTATNTQEAVASSASQTIALAVTAAAPSLSVPAALSVAEGGSVAMAVIATAFDPSDPISITISGIPSDASLSDSAGPLVVANGSVTLTSAQLLGLSLTAGEDKAASLTVTATETNGQGMTTSATKTIALIVNPVPEPPGLSGTLTTASGNEGSAIPLTIIATAVDADDVLSITVTGVPVDASLSAGTKNADGSWTLTAAQLTGLKLNAGEMSGTLHVVMTNTTAGEVGSVATDIAATVNPVPEPPGLAGTVTTASGNEGSAIPLTIVATAADGDDVLSIAITGVPSDASLSAGTKNTDGSWTLSTAQLLGLKLDAGHTSSTLHVVATNTTTGEVASTATDIKLTVATSGPPPVPVFDLAAGDQTGTPGQHQTQSGRVTLVGQTGPGDKVTLLSTGESTVAGTSGAFQLTNVALALGDNPLTVQATDAAGSTSTYSLTIDRPQPSATPDPVIQWNQITLHAIALDADPPTVASRSLAIESLAVFDTVSAIDGTPGYLVNMTAPADASPIAAVAAAADEILDDLYPAQAAAFDAQLATSLGAIPDGQSKTDGVALGKAVADRIIALRANDGSNVNTTDTGGNGVGVWQPTPPSYAPALDPQWANLEPFALNSPDQFLPPPLPDPTSAAYAAAVNETQSLGSATSTTRTADETQIAKFWNDQTGTYTPPGDWNAIADSVAQQQGDGLAADARLFAELNVAEADAAIAAWNSKFDYNAWRPVTAIRNANEIGNPGITQDPSWTSLITTPPFPEYVAGHPTYSAAAAQILDSVFGSNYAFSFTDPSIGSLPGVTRNFTSFDQAAQEAGESRVYGGIHFQFSVDAGLSLGTSVGDWVLKAFDLSQDTVPPKIVLDQTSGLVTNKGPTITGDVTDNLSGAASLTVSLDGGTATNVTFDSNGSFSIPTALPLDGSADGQHSLSLIATRCRRQCLFLDGLLVPARDQTAADHARQLWRAGRRHSFGRRAPDGHGCGRDRGHAYRALLCVRRRHGDAGRLRSNLRRLRPGARPDPSRRRQPYADDQGGRRRRQHSDGQLARLIAAIAAADHCQPDADDGRLRCRRHIPAKGDVLAAGRSVDTV
jgi:VCBS repeat-containing protein